jgi:hypothetical protein
LNIDVEEKKKAYKNKDKTEEENTKIEQHLADIIHRQKMN